MRTTDAFQHFDSPSAVASALGISRAAVSKWRDVVPYASAKRLVELTDGALRIDESLYDAHLRPVRPDDSAEPRVS